MATPKLIGFNEPDAAPPAPSKLSFAVAADEGASGDTFTVAGSGVAGDTVTLFDGTTAIGTADVTADGTWSITTPDPLAIGAHSLSASEADSEGDTSGASPSETISIASASPDNQVTFDFSVAALQATENVVGGPGSDTLELTTAGTVDASGVSGVEIYQLANGGANKLTLSNANFAGVTDDTITVDGGGKGDRIDASGLTGSHQAILIGGAGDDTLIAGRHETMTGGSGADTFILTTPGTLAAPDTNTITDFTHSIDKIAFSDAGFNLGLAGAGATPTALPSSLFASNATGTFDSSTERFVYDTTTGQLFYDAHGNRPGSSVQLVATLTGHPTLTVSDLFYVS